MAPFPWGGEAALEVHWGTAMIISISLEKERYDKLLPLLAGRDSCCMKHLKAYQATRLEL